MKIGRRAWVLAALTGWLLLTGSPPVLANDLSSGSLTADCTGFTPTVNAVSLTPGIQYTVTYNVVPNGCAPQSAAAAGSFSFIAPSSAGSFGPSPTPRWSDFGLTLSGACNVTGTATLTSSGSQVQLTPVPNPLTFSCAATCTGAIGDFVWNDTNGNGIQDASEPGINGVTVRLQDSSGNQLKSMITSTRPGGGSDGYYQFTGLCAGTYNVVVDTSTLPAGFSPSPCTVGADRTADNNCSPAPVTLPNNSSSDQTIDFGYKSAASIDLKKQISVDGGSTWADADTPATAPVVAAPAGAQYRFIVTNTGPQGLVNVTVNDATLGIANVSIGELGAGQSVTIASTTPGFGNLDQPNRCSVAGTFTNIASVIGTPVLGGSNVTASNPAVLICQGCTCPTTFLNIGAAAQYGVFALNTSSKQTANFSNVTVNGNVAIAAGATLKLMAPSTINGNLVVDSAGSWSKGPGKVTGTVTTNADLSGARTAALNASATAAGLSPGFTFSNITSNQTVNGNSGLNVVRITGNINLSDHSLTLSGPADAFFVINLAGSLTLGGSGGIVTSGGVNASKVLINMTGSGSLINTHVGNIINGVVLGPNVGGTIHSANGSFILGRDFTLMSGAKVNFQPCTCQ